MSPLRLVTLGRLALVDQHGTEDPIGKRRRKLALLALLALAKRPLSRDTLVDLFWGEQPEERGRHSLSDALSHLRSVLGRDAIASRQAEVALTADARLVVDALDLAAAAAAGRHAEVVSLYGGPFLEGVHIPDSVRFDAWLSRERARLERTFLASCAVVCREAAKAEQWDECAAVARRWLDVDPASAEGARLLLDATAAPRTADALRQALAEYERLRVRLRADLELAPDADVVARARRLADELAALRPADDAVAPPAPPASPPVTPPAVADVDAPAAAPATAPAASPGSTVRRPWRRLAVGVAAAAVVVAALARWTARREARAAESARQVVAIVDTRTPAADTAVGWLRDGFALMVASSLARTPELEVVPASRVHSLAARGARTGGGSPPDEEQLLDVARRLGARWAVGASLARVEGAYVVQLAMRDARDGTRRDFTISGTSILAVADEAAARVRGVADAAAPGPHLADVETANVDAFEHFVRATQAGDEGRYADQLRELDAAIAADSGFTSALVARMRLARYAVDTTTVARLSAAYARAASRITRWDELEQSQYFAFHNGEHARAEALAQQLVSAYPHDPRAYLTLANTFASHGKWAAADSALERVLRLDSLAIAAGDGPCAPCTSYAGLIENHLVLGERAAAERAARRWLALQPELPVAWAALATVLAFDGRFDQALDAERHAAQLAGDDAEYAMRVARILVMARRLDAADSLVRTWPRDVLAYRLGALDLEAVIARERGQWGRAERTLRRVSEEYHDGGMTLVHASTLARLGRYDAARREFEAMTTHGPLAEPASPVRSLAGDRARSFAWHHTLEADALVPTHDTTWLAALADSIAQVGGRSYFARDWRLADHVRGLVALETGRPREAAAAFARARFGVAGWTRTNVGLAEALLALGDARDAIAALRDAYQAPPDAMGRYLARSELDYWMARAFAAARLPDSARVYARHATDAWTRADASMEPRRREMVALAGAER